MALVIQAEAMPGDDITNTAKEMCELADKLGCGVSVTFNDVYLLVLPGNDPDDVVRDFQRCSNNRGRS